MTEAARALPDLVSRIKIDSSGVDAAMADLAGSFGKANLALAGLAVGIGILIMGGKSMIDIAEKHNAAELSLAQAVKAHNDAIGQTAPLTAEATAAIAKAADVSSKAADALTISQNAQIKAQLAYTDAVKKHGAASETAYKASLNLQDANIRLKQAQDAAADSSAALAAAQAAVGVKVTGAAINLTQYQRQIDDFVMTNKRYISDQAEVVDGYAKLTRSGLSQTEVQRAMNDAVDLAALKHISLSDAVTLLDNAEHGRMKGLIDLGITTSKYTDAQGNLIAGTKDASAAMLELDGKLKGGRQSLSENQQALNSLGIEWQKFAVGPGTELQRALTNAVEIGDLFLQFLDEMGHNNPLWDAIESRLVAMAKWIHDYVIAPLQAFGNWTNGGILMPSGPNQANKRASGGPVIPGGIYTVGENGPETLIMGANGGMVVPGASSTYNLTLNGAGAANDPEGVRRVLQRMQLLGAAG